MHLTNDLGLPKRFIRSLQIAEVVNSMKELISFSHDRKIRPIESLNNYSQGSWTNQTSEKQGFVTHFELGCFLDAWNSFRLLKNEVFLILFLVLELIFGCYCESI